MASWFRHLTLLRAVDWTEVWLLCGRQGRGKTSTALGILDILVANGWTWTVDPAKRADVLYWDDLGRWFSKRNWNSKVGKEIQRFLQVVRCQYTLVLGTAPDAEDLDVSIRTSGIAEVIDVITNGVARWRDIIRVPFRMPENEEWRFAYGERLSQIMEEY